MHKCMASMLALMVAMRVAMAGSVVILGGLRLSLLVEAVEVVEFHMVDCNLSVSVDVRLAAGVQVIVLVLGLEVSE